MGMLNLDLTRLYFGDYVGDTMDLTADQHTVFQKLLLQLWLQRPVVLKTRWLRKQSRLSRGDWHFIHPLLLEPLGTALAGVHRWNEAIRAYDGRRLPPFEWQILRTLVLARDDYTCVYCGSTEDLHADHRISITRGGSNALDNVVTACAPCNLSKGPKTIGDWMKSRGSTKSVKNARGPIRS
ncbi:MAG: endonuclease [Mucilaginibacter sp.]|nr:endonuclease [Mucilaginibacter sp.]